MPQDSLPLRHIVLRDKVPEGGVDVRLAPEGGTLEDVARFLSIPGVQALEADLHVTRHGKSGLRVRGRVTGRVVQRCVVTLEPVENPVDETVDTIYAPADSPVLNVELTPEDLASEESDLEPMADGSIDLGGLVMQHVVLSLDPYPRKPGIAFEPVEEDTQRPSPFAALQRLKGEGGEG